VFQPGFLSGNDSEENRSTQRPSFTTAVYTVLVDVIVTDKSNRHVNDLRRRVELYENGGSRPLTPLISDRKRDATVSAARGAPAQPASVPAARRINMINFLLDYSTTEFDTRSTSATEPSSTSRKKSERMTWLRFSQRDRAGSKHFSLLPRTKNC